MYFQKRIRKKFNKNDYFSFILAGDIGGTNVTFGLFGMQKKIPELLASFHFKSKELKNIYEAVNRTLDCISDDSVTVANACFAVAGVLSPAKDFAEVTNATWDVDVKLLLRRTKLRQVLLLNDFEAIGYGIGMLKDKDIVTIKKARKLPNEPVVIVGAGTGLGKATLVYDENRKSYSVLRSEAGHTDFPVQSKEELELVEFIKKSKKIKTVPYEQVLSGQGLENIYFFLKKYRKFPATKYTIEIEKAKDKPSLISKYRNSDKTCNETFRIFQLAYAKFARNFALDSLALGGVYIAGGIAPKNRDMFNKKFAKIFEENYVLSNVLKKIPVYLILNYDVGLLGAGFIGAKMA